jgi:hypothetical protein
MKSLDLLRCPSQNFVVMLCNRWDAQFNIT